MYVKFCYDKSVLLVLEGADWLVVRGCFVEDPVGVASLKSCSKGLASSNS